MKKSLDEIKEIIEKHKEELKERHPTGGYSTPHSAMLKFRKAEPHMALEARK